jgi:hypothetical protein
MKELIKKVFYRKKVNYHKKKNHIKKIKGSNYRKH